MHKALVIASVASMIEQFNMPNVRLLQELGYEVDVACNFVEGNTCSDERVAILKQTLSKMKVRCVQIDFSRNVFKAKQNLKAYRQVASLLKANHYGLIHSHSPIGGLLSRIAARNHRQKGTRVIYTAHGFHFFKGSPMLNWLIFYPIEKLSSYLTDVLITITKEDYALALDKMRAKKVTYIPGIGLDTKYFSNHLSTDERLKKRQDLGLSDDDIVVLSVGELNKNKNHEVILRAIEMLGRRDIHYVIAGRGALQEHLTTMADYLGLSSQLHLLGFRSDIKELFNIADIFAHPSYREGLSVAMMEAMASSLPILSSDIRGSRDLIDDGKGGFLFQPNDAMAASIALGQMLDNDNKQRFGAYNRDKALRLDTKVVQNYMRDIYTNNL